MFEVTLALQKEVLVVPELLLPTFTALQVKMQFIQMFSGKNNYYFKSLTAFIL